MTTFGEYKHEQIDYIIYNTQFNALHKITQDWQ